MSRPHEPGIKDELLKKCFKVVLKKGSLDISINELGEKVGSSGRMLVYHFGSKTTLDRLLSGYLERTLRKEFTQFAEAENSSDRFLIEFWNHVTSDKQLILLLRLAHEISSYSIREKALRSTMEEETVSWISLLREHLKSEEIANVVLLLFQGALLDFLMTGDNSRGRQALEKILNSKF